MRRPAAVLFAITLCATVSGCQWTGLNSLPLPGTKGHGPGSYQVSIEMPDVTTITPNSPVLVDDVEVGSITAIGTENWHARVTVTLNRETVLPANATAKIGQTSLLGTAHVELAAPAEPRGTLTDGGVIPLDRAGDYPTTEQTLSALSMVLNGGGLGHLQTIVTEANKAIAGHQDSAGAVIDRMNTLLGELDTQRDEITATLGNLDRFAAHLAGDNDALGRAVSAVDPALGVLDRQRADLTTAFAALTRFGDAGTTLVDNVHGDLKQTLAGLAPTLRKVAETGDDLIANLNQLATFPFPPVLIDNGVRGDYMNLWAEADLTLPRLQQGLLFGTPFSTPPPTGPPPGEGR
ncbi:MCE family protein [Nocardia sp. BMG51109]|uniref:MCE family protein n=1 Tax=Nocardia sp. BMG51109 TaxID=1056816 RepID=UPI0004B579C5|nr:MCE family protein [Nocardia sp. BMG51109]